LPGIARLFHWLEASQLGHWMRESGVWTYGIVNLGHILGIATLFGAILLLDLRMLGAWRGVPLAGFSRAAVTAAACGAALAIATGIPMLATKAGDYVGNPFLFIKFPAIALALINIVILHRSAAWKAHRTRELLPPERRRLSVHASISLLCWLTVISAGRMIAYW
jgi:hypothetical protein